MRERKKGLKDLREKGDNQVLRKKGRSGSTLREKKMTEGAC